jgi:hypothetical protein
MQLLEVAECLEVIQAAPLWQITVHKIPLSRRLGRLPDLASSPPDSSAPIQGASVTASATLLVCVYHCAPPRNVAYRRYTLMAAHHAIVQDTVVTIRNNRLAILLKRISRQAIRELHGSQQAEQRCMSSQKVCWISIISVTTGVRGARSARSTESHGSSAESGV